MCEGSQSCREHCVIITPTPEQATSIGADMPRVAQGSAGWREPPHAQPGWGGIHSAWSWAGMWSQLFWRTLVIDGNTPPGHQGSLPIATLYHITTPLTISSEKGGKPVNQPRHRKEFQGTQKMGGSAPPPPPSLPQVSAVLSPASPSVKAHLSWLFPAPLLHLTLSHLYLHQHDWEVP